ncbi:hypothetical protein L6164_003151 [Bauhinia variegata]|uniref:Uncharacterized protein n=1 Tax=Bauhinia variegata TaxID=167791 RepID=A0ACB9Q5Y1_BAUVA|nr:hypothetical protein L6164_003151 [Bauhinia variegata]
MGRKRTSPASVLFGWIFSQAHEISDINAGFAEVKANEVVQSTQDCQGSDKDHQSNSFLQRESMTRHSGDLEAKEVHQEQKMRHISPMNRGESVKGRAEETVKKDLTLEKLQLRVSALEIIKQIPKSALVLIHQQHTLEESSDAAIPSLFGDLLSRLHLLLSSEAMSYLQDGFSRYPWTSRLLESWSDKSWNW